MCVGACRYAWVILDCVVEALRVIRWSVCGFWRDVCGCCTLYDKLFVVVL